MPPQERLDAYADLAVRVGANVQEGQGPLRRDVLP
jgi:hypothetical protein